MMKESKQNSLNIAPGQHVELYLSNGHVAGGMVSMVTWIGVYPYAVTVIEDLPNNQSYKRTILMDQVVEIRPRLEEA